MKAGPCCMGAQQDPSPPSPSLTAEDCRGLCCSPTLTILSQSLRGTLETWQEQVMAEEWRGARYGAGMVGQPGVCRSMATSSSSTSTTRARGFSKPGERGDGCCMWRPPHHHPLPGVTLAGRTSLRHLCTLHGEEINDTGGEVQRGQGLALQHADTVPVTIAGPWHPPTEDDEGVPAWDEAAAIRPWTPKCPLCPCPAHPPTLTRRFARGFC